MNEWAMSQSGPLDQPEGIVFAEVNLDENFEENDFDFILFFAHETSF